VLNLINILFSIELLNNSRFVTHTVTSGGAIVCGNKVYAKLLHCIIMLLQFWNEFK